MDTQINVAGRQNVLDGRAAWLSVLPWIAFSVLCVRTADDSVAVAAAAGLLLSVGVCVAGARRRTWRTLDISSVVIFAGVVSVGFLSGTWWQAWFSYFVVGTFGRGAALLALALVILVTSGFSPVSRQYQVHTVRPLPGHRAISAAWGTAVLLVALGAIVADVVGTTAMDPARIADLALNWALPVVLCGLAYAFAAHRLRVAASRDRMSSRAASAPHPAAGAPSVR